MKKVFLMRSLAIAMVFSVLNASLFPTISFALTIGPNQVEYLQFEDIGNTDLVDIRTGDFVYTMPLLDIPGPEGNYSLPLSYHAGISPESDASWVGLGWSLNAGAITRNVSQLPDDFAGETLSNYKYNKGGNGYSINYLLGNYHYDSEKGKGGIVSLFGIMEFGYGNQSGDISMFGISENGVDPLGFVNAAFSIISFGGSAISEGMIGATIQTVSTGYGVQQYVQGVQKMNRNFSEYDVSHKVTPLVFYTGYKYWIDETIDEKMYGSLYFNQLNYLTSYPSEQYKTFYSTVNNASINCGSLDHALPYFPSQITGDMHMSPKGIDDNYSVNPTSVAYDNYTVTGSGVSGNIRPYRLDIGSLPFSNYIPQTLKLYPVPFYSAQVNFRYDGDYSNNYSYQQGNTTAGSLPNNIQRGFDFGIAQNCSMALPYINLTDNILYDPNARQENNREGLVNQKLIQARNIEWYTNQDISINTATGKGFMDFLKNNPTDGSVKRSDFRNGLNAPYGIGGYSVTRADGMTYHYSLPVYNKKEYFYSQTSGTDYTHSTMSDKFAYQWLLTGITGPDFVDRPDAGEVGVIDNTDWGFWVKLDYGKFSSNYHWRSPYWNYQPSDNYTYSEGLKETYYLNTISTRSHTALFVKDLKTDGRSAYAKTSSSTSNSNLQDNGQAFDDSKPSSSLSLNEIILLKNEDYQTLKNNGFTFNGNSPEGIRNDESFATVLDEYDILGFRAQLTQMQLRRISFNYDYSLCENTLNSFPFGLAPPRDGEDIALTRYGKLTLKSLSIRGTNDDKLLPDYTFEYNNANPDYNEGYMDIWGMYLNKDNPNYKEDGKAWSLSRINNPLGGYLEVDYERDKYSHAAGRNLYETFNGFSKVQPYEDDLLSYYKVGQEVEVLGEMTCSSPNSDGSMSYSTEPITGGATITSITSTQVTINTPTFINHNPNCTLTSYNNGISDQVQVAKYGGNLRVKQIRSSDGMPGGMIYKTNYVYSNDGTSTGLSTGEISQEPGDAEFNLLYDYPNTPVLYSTVNVYTGVLSNDQDFKQRKEFKFGQFTPLTVTLTEDVDYLQNSWIIGNYQGLPYYGHISAKNYLVDINNDKMGAIQSISIYDNKNNQLSSTAFQYKTDQSRGFFTEGSIYASSNTSPTTNNDGRDLFYRFARTTKRYFPNILESVTTTTKGVTNTVKNLEWDFYSGAPLKKELTNSYGQKFISVSEPAYKKYPAMGSKATNPGNSNMFTQMAATYLYKGSEATGPVTSAQIQTWDNQWKVKTYDGTNFQNTDNNVWRKKSAYVWNSVELNKDGTFKNFIPFNWNGSNDLYKWIKANEVTRYDQYSKPLEVKDVNSNFGSTIYGYNGKLAICGVSNANLASAAYTGFENLESYTNNTYFEGNVSNGGTQFLPTTFSAHTGTAVGKLDGGQSGFVFSSSNLAGNNISGQELITGRKYRASVWVHISSDPNATLQVTLNGTVNGVQYTSPDLRKKLSDATENVNGWKLLVLDFDVPQNYKSAVGQNLSVILQNTNGAQPAYFDDFRICPINSSLNASVYDQHTYQLTHKLDENNFYVKYEYNSNNQVKAVYKETSRGVFKVKDYEYHYNNGN